jgi:hypothetical protein
LTSVLLWCDEPHPYIVAAERAGRARELFVENLRRFLAGEPLRAVVDRARGY